MKSKKIVAMIVAFAAFMAVATSGLAAVTTTTEYYIDDLSKVSVKVDVTGADENSEVTYLVESGDQIVYIDQKTADENGATDFNYKISKAKLADYAAEVRFGTDGETAIENSDATFEFEAVDAETDNAKVEIAFYHDPECNSAITPEDDGTIRYGNSVDEAIYAKLLYDGNDCTVTGVTGLDPATSANVYKVVNYANITVTTEDVVKTPDVDIVGEVTSSAEIIDAADKAGITEDNKGNKLDYTNVVNKFVIAQDVPADKKIVLTCKNPKDDTQTLEFPVVADSYTGSLDNIVYYMVRFVQNGSEIDLSGIDFDYILE